MRLSFYSIHDAKLGVYLAPFMARADVEAVRQLRNSMADPQMANSPMVLAPSDFYLVRVGYFDDETGEVVGFAGSGPMVVVQLSKLAEM